MRIALELDVSTAARRIAARLGKPFKQVVNSALRIGLDEMRKPAIAKPYRTRPRAMGRRVGLNYDNVAELLQVGTPWLRLVK